jgi:hypothetical protein
MASPSGHNEYEYFPLWISVLSFRTNCKPTFHYVSWYFCFSFFGPPPLSVPALKEFRTHRLAVTFPLVCKWTWLRHNSFPVKIASYGPQETYTSSAISQIVTILDFTLYYAVEWPIQHFFWLNGIQDTWHFDDTHPSLKHWNYYILMSESFLYLQMLHGSTDNSWPHFSNLFT